MNGPLEIVTYPGVAFEDGRGVIKNLVSGPELRHVAFITSAAGSIRANHWHPDRVGEHRGDQWIAVLRGSYVSVACRVDGAGRFVGDPEHLVVREGAVVYTPPGVGHAQWFVEPTEFLNIDGITRETAGFGETHTFPLPTPLIRPPRRGLDDHEGGCAGAAFGLASAHYDECLSCGWVAPKTVP